MSQFEIKSLKIVIQLLIFNVFCIAFYLYQSFLQATYKPNFADDFYAYLILVLFFGIHSLFAFITYLLAKIRFPFEYRKRTAYFSLFMPYLVIALNINVIASYEYSYWLIIFIVYFVYKDIKSNLLGKNFTMYINVLANPSGYEHEMVFPSAFEKFDYENDDEIF